MATIAAEMGKRVLRRKIASLSRKVSQYRRIVKKLRLRLWMERNGRA